MTVSERYEIMLEMAEAKIPLTGSPYSAHDVYDVHAPLVNAEVDRLIEDHKANGDNSELSQEVARRQSVGA